MPLTAASIGTLTSSSTSWAVNPRHAVWISTRGGANSGKTSTDAAPNCREPSSITAHARATTTVLKRRLIPMSQRMSLGRIEFGAEKFLRACRDHHGPRRRPARQDGNVAVDALDRDGVANID